MEDRFCHSLGNLRSAQNAATNPGVSDESGGAKSDADVSVGGGAAPEDLEPLGQPVSHVIASSLVAQSGPTSCAFPSLPANWAIAYPTQKGMQTLKTGSRIGSMVSSRQEIAPPPKTMMPRAHMASTRFWR